MHRKNGFVLTESILAISLTTMIVISLTVLICTIFRIASRYSAMEQSKLWADSAVSLIKSKLIFADEVRFNTVDTYDKFFKIEDGVLYSENGDLYGENNFANYQMQIELETQNYGLIKLCIKILDKNSAVLYDTSTAFKVNLLNKLSKSFGGQTGILINPIIYYQEDDT